MRYRILFLFAILVVSFQGRAAVDSSTDYQFVNNRAEEFTAFVGQMDTRMGFIRFADAEIPPDPTVVRSGGMDVNFDGLVDNQHYSIEIEGADCAHFSARLVKTSFTSNECTVAITYTPRAIGTHTAIVRAYCSKAGVPLVSIPLRGESTAVLGDLNGDGKLGITDVVDMINLLMKLDEEPPLADVNSDGLFNITDVTLTIGKLLDSE